MEAIILAAGYSSRAKDFKMNLRLGQKTVLEHTLSKFEGICDRVIVITGYQRERIEATVKAIVASRQYSFEIQCIYNEAYDKGMFTSIKKGCKAITKEQFFLTPGDCPIVLKETIKEIANEDGDIIIPSYNYKGGHPIKLSDDVRKFVIQRDDDDNLREIMKRFNKTYINVEDEGVLLDMDTPDDYKKIQKYYNEMKKENSMTIKHIANKQFDGDNYKPFLVTNEISDEVKAYHESFADYNETELVYLKELSNRLGLGKLYVKDESTRFNLNAFKVLGAAYAVGKALAEKLGADIKDLPFETMKKRVSEELSDVTLVATTDGNHGRGVSWMGKQLGLKVIIYMPNGTTQNRLNHILNLGANGTITEMNYDDTVRWVAEEAKSNNWLIIQDTAWEGYEDVPIWIMQGYSTMAKEIIEKLSDEVPTHIFLQAGVGAFAGVMAEVFHTAYKDKLPKIVVVEADVADCYYRSAIEEKEVVVTGDLFTIMAGLACGEANPIGYKVLFQLAHSFVSCPDFVAANGMRIMGNPLKGDQPIVSGESGAVSVGLLEAIMTRPEYKEIKDSLELDESSVVLTFSTEGDTDETVYRDVVWYGKHAE